jgi:HD-GYP domain-containing protein (c-di-GMP phosphodiesterase class II)
MIDYSHFYNYYLNVKPEKIIKKNIKIRSQLILVLLGVTIVPLLIFGLLNIQANEDNLEDYERLQQTNLAARLKVEIDNFMERNFGLAQALSFNITAQIEASSGNRTIYELGTEKLLHDFLQRSPNFHFVSGQSLNATKRITLSEGKFNFSIEDELQRYYDDGKVKISSGGTFMSPVVRSKSLGKEVVLYTIPIFSKGSPVGLLSTVISLDYINRLILETAGDNYEICVIDSLGKLISQANMEYVKDEEDLKNNELLTDYLRPDSPAERPRFSINQVYDVRVAGKSEEYLGTFTPIENLEWALVVQLNSQIAFKPVQMMINRSIIMLIFAAMIAVLTGLFFANTISKPLSMLTKATNVIAEGKFDLPIVIHSRNEIGILADRFNSMSGEIQKFIVNLKDAARKNKDLFISSIRMISAAVDEKDPYTRGHSEKVREFSVEIARVMGLSPEQIEKIAISAILHDVGKIGIQDNVLNKAGTLTPDEFEIMKQHPEKGAYIISPINELSDIVPGILYHHEKWDGTGYPKGLKSEAIPLTARIIAVADTFDAMSSDRPYQKSMEVDYVFKLLFDWAGKRYDADVVASLFQAYEAGRIKLSKTRSSIQS